jgi:hypothetical protein
MTGAAASTGCGAVAIVEREWHTPAHAAARGAMATSRRRPLQESESCMMRIVQGSPAS